MKSAHIPTMLELLAEGAKDRPVSITTVELAKRLNKSQQMASKHLEEMEEEGLIERIRAHGDSCIKVTEKGLDEAAKIYSGLDAIFGNQVPSLEVEGTVFDGLGEAAYYVSQPGYNKQFISKLGFEPYPGTLNLRLTSAADREVKRNLFLRKGIHIDGYRDGKRTYGGAECFPSILNDRARSAVLQIERTSHDDSVLEIIAPQNLRKTLHLSPGSRVKVRILFDGERRSV